MLEWVMGRPERVVAVVSHGLTMRAVFWDKRIFYHDVVRASALQAAHIPIVDNFIIFNWH